MRNEMIRQWVKIIGIGLVGVGVLFLVLNFFLGEIPDIALPLVFVMLGAAFYILVSVFSRKYAWASLLYIPGSILVALGMVLLLNGITKDWSSWAYAWLLLVAGAGIGLLLAGWHKSWPQWIPLVGVNLAVGGITLFTVFGAIAGGLFIRIMAPILLVLGGLALWWLKPEMIFPERFFHRTRSADNIPENLPAIPDQSALVEPLSPREIEVLQLINQGLSNPEIAAKLTLAPSTVKTHINNIYGKLGVQTRVQALKRAQELRLLKP